MCTGRAIVKGSYHFRLQPCRTWASTSTSSSARQSSFLTCGCFCVLGLIHHKPFLETSRQAGHIFARGKDSHNTGNFTPYSLRAVCGFFNVPRWNFKLGRYCETGPTVYSPYPRRLESLTICWCNCKGSTFSSVILRPWVLVRPESNSQPPAWQPDAQKTELTVRGIAFPSSLFGIMSTALLMVVTISS